MNSEEFPDYLYNYINENNIDIGRYGTRGLGVIFPNGLMFINGNDSLEEQVQALLHEVIHMHPKFIAYTGGIYEGRERDESIEAEIEVHATRLYKSRKDIVEIIKRVLVNIGNKTN